MKKAPARPQPAQLDAIHRLAGQGRLREAQSRLTALRSAFPDYKPLLALAWELANDAGDHLHAALAAWDWTRASPNSAAAWESLLESAGVNFAAVSLLAMRRIEELAGQPAQPEPEPMPNPFGPIPFEQAIAMDMARMFLSGNRLAEARAALTGVDHVSAHNNLALLCFAEGDVAAAQALLAESARQVPDNLFGLEHLARMRLWTGGMDSAAELAPQLAAIPPRRGDDLRAKLHGLILLERLDEAEAAWREAADEFLDDIPQGRDDHAYIGAFLAWHRGETRLARDRLNLATGPMTQIRSELADAETSRDTPDWALGQTTGWWPLSSIERMRALPRKDLAAILAELLSLQPHNDYLARMVELGGQGARLLAVSALEHRAQSEDAGAQASLFNLLARPCGPDQVRHDLRARLFEMGLIKKGSHTRVRLQGEIRELRNLSFRITNAAADEIGLPPAAAARYERSIELYRANRLGDAAAELESLLPSHPDNPRLLANLALVLVDMDAPLEDIEPLARQAHALAPDYAFGRIALAHVLITRGDPSAANELLLPILEREEIHISEWRACLGAQLRSAIAMDEVDAERDIRRSIRESTEMFR